MTPSATSKSTKSRPNMTRMISLVPNGLPVRRQFSAPILRTKRNTAIQKSVKKPWNGLLAASAFWRSKVEKVRVKTRSLNFPWGRAGRVVVCFGRCRFGDGLFSSDLWIGAGVLMERVRLWPAPGGSTLLRIIEMVLVSSAAATVFPLLVNPDSAKAAVYASSSSLVGPEIPELWLSEVEDVVVVKCPVPRRSGVLDGVGRLCAWLLSFAPTFTGVVTVAHCAFPFPFPSRLPTLDLSSWSLMRGCWSVAWLIVSHGFLRPHCFYAIQRTQLPFVWRGRMND